MKITGNYYTAPVGKKNIQKQNDVEKPSFKNQLQSMDSITISASRNQIADAHFVTSLKNQITTEIEKGTPTEELDSLAGQVSRGEYEIGANEVARKILLMGGDE